MSAADIALAVFVSVDAVVAVLVVGIAIIGLKRIQENKSKLDSNLLAEAVKVSKGLELETYQSRKNLWEMETFFNNLGAQVPPIPGVTRVFGAIAGRPSSRYGTAIESKLFVMAAKTQAEFEEKIRAKEGEEWKCITTLSVDVTPVKVIEEVKVPRQSTTKDFIYALEFSRDNFAHKVSEKRILSHIINNIKEKYARGNNR